MGVSFKGGVVIGADSRTTTGSYIANRVTDKLTPLGSQVYISLSLFVIRRCAADYIYCCRSGSAADTQAVAEFVKYHLASHRFYHCSLLTPTTKCAPKGKKYRSNRA